MIAQALKTFERVGGLLQPRYVYLVFFVLPLFIYYPLLGPGMILQGGTDVLFDHYPALLFGQRAMSQGELGLWNRFMYSGFDLTHSLHHHILHPINWLVLLVPDSYVLRVMSLQLFLEICAVGCLGYLLSGQLLNSTWARLLVGLTVQLCGFTWFCVTTFGGVHLLFLTLLSMHFIATVQSRRGLASFVILSACFAGIMLMGHPAYIGGFGIVVFVTFVAVLVNVELARDRVNIFWLTMAAGLVGLAMAAFRIYPVVEYLAEGGEGLRNIWLNPRLFWGYFSLTGLIPNAVGLDVNDSSQLFDQLGGQGHVHAGGLIYYGIPCAFLVYFALLGKLGKQAAAIGVAAVLFAIAPVNLVPPISDAMFFLLLPAGHGAFFRIVGNFLVLASFAFAIRQFEQNPRSIAVPTIRNFAAALAGVLILFLTFWAQIFHASREPRFLIWINNLQGMVLLVIIIGFVVSFYRRSSPSFPSRITDLAACLFGVATAAVVATEWAPVLNQDQYFWRDITDNAGAAAWWLAVVFFARSTLTEGLGRLFSTGVALVAASVALAVIFAPVTTTGPRFMEAVVVGAFSSAAKFALLGCIIMELFALAFHERFDPRLLLPLLVALSVGDLLFFNRTHQFMNGPPFVPLDRMYPDITLPDLTRALRDWNDSSSQPELLTNPQLEMKDNSLAGWNIGGRAPSAHVAGQPASALVLDNGADSEATLYTDIALPNAPEFASFGAWVRTSVQRKSNLLLVAKLSNNQSSYHSGSGKWEWLSVTVSLRRGELESLRPHVFNLGVGRVEILGPHLIAGKAIKPWISPPSDEISSTPALIAAQIPPPSGEELDLQQYRVSHPHYLVPFYHEPLMTNIPMVYEIPTYAGVDSDVPADYLEFLSAFQPPSKEWFHRAGLLAVLTNARLLDLLGVRYDAAPAGEVTIRPNALARVSLFKQFEVVANRKKTFDRLRDPAFDPTHTVVVDSEPPWQSQASSAVDRFRPIVYQSPRSSRIEVMYDEPTPSILLFNDSFSKSWRASLDDTDIPIYRANGNFMAVSLPAGKGSLVFTFEPKTFLRLLRISIGLGIVLIVLGAYVAISHVHQIRWARRHGFRLSA